MRCALQYPGAPSESVPVLESWSIPATRATHLKVYATCSAYQNGKAAANLAAPNSFEPYTYAFHAGRLVFSPTICVDPHNKGSPALHTRSSPSTMIRLSRIGIFDGCKAREVLARRLEDVAL